MYPWLMFVHGGHRFFLAKFQDIPGHSRTILVNFPGHSTSKFQDIGTILATFPGHFTLKNGDGQINIYNVREAQ